MANDNLPLYAALGIGGFLLYRHFRGTPAAAVAPTLSADVATCVSRKGDRGWTAETCTARLNALRAAYSNSRAKMAETVGTPAYDAWQLANDGHRNDYYALTGMWLS